MSATQTPQGENILTLTNSKLICMGASRLASTNADQLAQPEAYMLIQMLLLTA